MGSSNPRTGQNRDQALNRHGHVDNDPISCLELELGLQSPSQTLHSLVQLTVSNLIALRYRRTYLRGDGTLVEVGHLVSPVLEMDVETLLGDVDSAVGKPAVEMEIVD